jgi:nucleoside-diphosphate-sugar epimerase
MKVLVTGGTGRVGAAAVRRLLEHGHEVTVAGRRPEREVAIGRTAYGGTASEETQLLPDGAVYRRCDVGDYDAVEGVVRGQDGVVHLAAIPHPVGNPGRTVFQVNTSGTFNVFEAAAECGVPRVVNASSINAVGMYYGDRSLPIQYLPVDEAHPTLQTDAYSFSKLVSEQIADYFWERDGITSISVRLPGVIPHHIPDSWKRHSSENHVQTIAEELLGAGGEQRLERLQRMYHAYERFRRAHRAETEDRSSYHHHEVADLTHAERAFMLRQVNFFTHVDELDSAQAIELGLTVEYTGSHTLFINSAHNSLGLPLSEIAKLYRPPVPRLRSQHPGDTCVMSIDRARDVLGYAPEW